MCQQRPLSGSLRQAASSQQLLAPRGVLRGVGAVVCWARLGPAAEGARERPGQGTSEIRLPTINKIKFQLFLNI